MLCVHPSQADCQLPPETALEPICESEDPPKPPGAKAKAKAKAAATPSPETPSGPTPNAPAA